MRSRWLFSIFYTVSVYATYAGSCVVFLLHTRQATLSCFLSDRLQCEQYYGLFYSLKWPTNTIDYTNSDLANAEAIIPCLLFCHQKCYVNKAENCLRCELLNCFFKKNHTCLRNGTNVQNWCQNVISTGIYGPIIIAAFTTNHTSTLTLCKGTSWINIRKLLFWGFMYPLRLNQVPQLHRSVGLFTVHVTHEGNSSQNSRCFTNYTVEFVNHSCVIWITMQQPFCISCWWLKQARLLYFQACDFLGDVFNLALISSSYSSVNTCLLRFLSCVEWKLLLETFHMILYYLLFGALALAIVRPLSHYTSGTNVICRVIQNTRCCTGIP